MKTIYQYMALAAVLGLASSGLYAGDRNAITVNESFATIRPLSANCEIYQNGYLQTSKGSRLDVADRLAAREEPRDRTILIFRSTESESRLIKKTDHAWNPNFDAQLDPTSVD